MLTIFLGLSQVATKCGYKPPQRGEPPAKLSPPAQSSPGVIKAPHPKGTARKEAKGAKKPEPVPAPPTKHTLTTKDLLSQAAAVAGRVEVPDRLRGVLERAIDARQHCADWFRTSKVDNEYSNEGHRQYIEILEQTLDIIGRSKKVANCVKTRKKPESVSDEQNDPILS
jgi:hypothetical protein